MCIGRQKELSAYPSIIEFGLKGDVFTLFLVLSPKDLKFGRFQRTARVVESVSD